MPLQLSPELGPGITSVLEDIEKYLRAQSDLFGTEMLVDRLNGIPSASPESTRELVAEMLPEAPPPQAVREQSLFGKYPSEAWTSSENLESLNSQICNCLKCGLGSTRVKFVFG